jgi:hypothetical protein
MEQRSVRAGFDIVDDRRLEIEVEGARNVFTTTRLREKGRKAAVGVGGRAIKQTTVGLSWLSSENK